MYSFIDIIRFLIHLGLYFAAIGAGRFILDTVWAVAMGIYYLLSERKRRCR